MHIKGNALYFNRFLTVYGCDERLCVCVVDMGESASMRYSGVIMDSKNLNMVKLKHSECSNYLAACGIIKEMTCSISLEFKKFHFYS